MANPAVPLHRPGNCRHLGPACTVSSPIGATLGGMAGSWTSSVLATALLAAAVGFASGASATETVVKSQSAYWKVGDSDKALSTACSIGNFTERSPGRYTARFFGKQGGMVLGIAKGTGLNLYDPNHMAKPNEDYFFRYSGSSDCQVFVGGRRRDGTQADVPKP